MPQYQKAYQLKDLRGFPGWHEDRYASGASGTSESREPLTDETVVFVHESLVVTHSCFDDEDIVFDELSPEWEAFCQETLKFEVPDWEAESAAVRKHLESLESASDD